MPRTILVADPEAGTRDRIAGIARVAGYRVVTAATAVEAAGAVDACPISAVIIHDGLLESFDLRRLLLHAPVLVLNRDLPRNVPPSELIHTLIDVAGDPRFPGRRLIFPFAFGLPARTSVP